MSHRVSPWETFTTTPLAFCIIDSSLPTVIRSGDARLFKYDIEEGVVLYFAAIAERVSPGRTVLDR